MQCSELPLLAPAVAALGARLTRKFTSWHAVLAGQEAPGAREELQAVEVTRARILEERAQRATRNRDVDVCG